MSSFHSFCKNPLTVASLLLVIACSQSLYVPTTETHGDALTVNELIEGRKLYIKNCGSCHNLYKPQTYSEAHWTKEMGEMQKEAKITDQQAALILKYVTSSK